VVVSTIEIRVVVVTRSQLDAAAQTVHWQAGRLACPGQRLSRRLAGTAVTGWQSESCHRATGSTRGDSDPPHGHDFDFIHWQVDYYPIQLQISSDSKLETLLAAVLETSSSDSDAFVHWWLYFPSQCPSLGRSLFFLLVLLVVAKSHAFKLAGSFKHSAASASA
jgi:hypothetical protein